MTLNEFVEKQKANLEEFQIVWFAQMKNVNLEYPDWQDQLRAWLEDEWEKENEE